MRAQQLLLQSAVTFRDASTRTDVVPETFPTLETALRAMTDVLLHEAHECMQTPLSTPPVQPYLHPVDVDTAEPGIVSSKTCLEILRMREDQVPRIGYHAHDERCKDHPDDDGDTVVVIKKTPRAAEREAEKKISAAIRRGERSAQTDERQRERRAERKQAREAETPEMRERRLREQREKREERARLKRQREEEEEEGQPSQKKEEPPQRRAPTAPCDPFPDASMANVLARPRRPARVKGSERFYEHPLPHHRHLAALRRAMPHPNIAEAILRAESSESLEIIQGPPGTGKTSRLVDILPRLSGRVLLCAPTNVGAANLYERCVHLGHGAECALSLAPDRIPPGTAVQSNDPSRRIVCATISSRSGPVLDAQVFEHVLVDEAAQCMEAWVWTLLRPEVVFLALAGDVHQLPAVVSETGRTLKHDRSLMERLLVRGYDNVTALTVQNRMCPEILRFPNERFYEGTLTCGPHAPSSGTVEVVDANGREAEEGTSYHNSIEADAIRKLCEAERLTRETTVILCPYVAQCRAILAQGLGVPVHTIDSFQGREADTVVVSLVRDGTSGVGFWSDDRRVAVALTRARRRLVLVLSNRAAWDHVIGCDEASRAAGTN